MRSKPLHMDGDLKDYTQEEILQIEAVLNSLFFRKEKSSKCKKAVFTGGHAGGGKSRFAYLLEKRYPNLVRIDINDNCLWAIPGYQRDYIENGPEAAYEKWRSASNYISRSATRKAIDEGYDFILVGTATSPHIMGLIKEAKSKGYTTEFHGFTAPLQKCLQRNHPDNRFSYLPDTGGVSFWLPEHHITDKHPLFNDRIPDLMTSFDRASMYWNPNDKKEPSRAFTCSVFGEDDNLRISIKNPSATLAFMKCVGWHKQPGAKIMPILLHHLHV